MPRFLRSALACADASRTSRIVMTSLLTTAAMPSTKRSDGAGTLDGAAGAAAGAAGREPDWAEAAPGRAAPRASASRLPQKRRDVCNLRIIHTFQKSYPPEWAA